MIDDRIFSFSPFRYWFVSYDDHTYDVTFTCPKCGSHDCIKLSYNGISPSLNFWEGNFMCSRCGISKFNGSEFNYYHHCFKKKRVVRVVQLTFDF